MNILEFDERAHKQQLYDCVVELQDYERALDARMPSGSEIVDEYVPQMLERCNSTSGKIFIAEVEGAIAGYVSIMTQVSSGELADGNIEYALINDILVREKYRGAGIGRGLLTAAEEYAIDHNVQWLRISVLAANRLAKELYSSMGFSELFIEMEKGLAK